MKRLIPILILTFLLFSCDVSSPEDADMAEILDILDSIKVSFNLGELDGIMQNYHPDFLHNTDSFTFEEIVWQERLNQYVLINFEDIEIELHDNFANVSFTMKLDEDVFNEPEDHGDVSHFYREFDGWKICGNEFSTE